MPVLRHGRGIQSSRSTSISRTRRSRRRYDLERLEERTLLAGGITGFNNGVGWTANTNGTGAPTLTANTLVLTNGLAQARSAFFNTLQPTNGPWTASFTYLPQTVDATTFADGATFMLQNQGPTALGSGGSGLGMAGITPSAEIEFNIYNAHVVGTAFETDGANSEVYMSTGAVDIASGDPIGVVLRYSGTTLTETLTDLTTSASFSTSYTVNLQSVLGLNASLVGFTGATGDGESVQTISDFSFSGSPSTTLTGTAGNKITGVEGSSTGTVLLGTFVDANQAATVANYTTPPGSVVVNWGDGSAPQTLAASNLTPIGTPNGVVWTINAAHTYTEEGTYAYTVTVTDVDGAATIVAGSAKVADATLTPGAPTALTPNTGVALPSTTVVGTFTDANTFATTADYTTSIDWGDGSPNSTGVVVATATPGVFDVEGGHTYAKPGKYTTLITVIDQGGSRAIVTGTATVTDLPVTGSTGNFTAVEGQNTGTFALATFTDPNTLATVADVNAQLAIGGWGDGMPTVAGITLVVQEIGVTPLTIATDPGAPIFEVLGSHTYAKETPAGLPDTLSVVITTLGGATTTLTSPPGGGVTVLDAPLTSSNGTTIKGIEGNTTGTVLIGTFTDLNQGATNADFTSGGGSVVVNWGDGSAPQTLTAANLTKNGSADGVVFSITAAHTYAEEGQDPITITVTDAGGSNAIISSTALISDAPLTASPTQPTVLTIEAGFFPVPQFGSPLFNGEVASFTDANPKAPVSDFTATIDWGDGTPPSAGTVVQLGPVGSPFEVFGTHTYADAGVNTGTGTFPIHVYITDVGGSKLTVQNEALVQDRPIVLTGKLDPSSDSGVSDTDDITNVKQPEFIGSSEAFSTVTLYAAPLAGGGGPIVIGQVEAGSDGSWNITSAVPLADGSYFIYATAIDQFQRTTTPPGVPIPITQNLVIDTVGPVITNAVWNRLNGQVDYTIQDPAPLSGVNVASLLDSSNYLFTKVHANKAFPGKWIATNVSVTAGAAAGSYNVDVTFNNGNPIRGGFYLFTIRDSSNGASSVEDIAGNHLDGVFYGRFPSGNGIPGSDFVAMLSGFHNKIFSPQTIVGTASNANGGVGGPPVGAVHSGNFTRVIPRGSRPALAKRAALEAKLRAAAKARTVARQSKIDAGSHPKGPLHS
jgi:hypothetical protein